MIKQLKEDIEAVFARDPAARNTLEVLTTYPGIHALIMHRMAHELWKKEYKGTARHLAALQQELKSILAQKLVNAFLSIMVWVLSLVKQLKLVMMSRFIMV